MHLQRRALDFTPTAGSLELKTTPLHSPPEDSYQPTETQEGTVLPGQEAHFSLPGDWEFNFSFAAIGRTQ